MWLWCMCWVFVANAQEPFLAAKVSSKSMLEVEPIDLTDRPSLAPISPQKPLVKTSPAQVFTPSLYAYNLEDTWISHQPLYALLKDYKPSSIDRSYYTNNPFNIEDSDNPFSLGRPKAALADMPMPAQGSKIKEVWQAVVVLDNPDTKSGQAPVWLSFVMFGLLGFVAMQFALYRADVFKSFQAFINATAAGQVHREQFGLFSPAHGSAMLTWAISGGIFAFLVAGQLAGVHGFNTFTAMTLCVLGLGGVSILNSLKLKALSILLPFGAEFEFYKFMVSNTQKVLGLGLIPMSLLLAYAPDAFKVPVLWAAGLSLLGVYGLRNIKALAMCADIVVSYKAHFLIYLLAVEIAPLLILFKILS